MRGGDGVVNLNSGLYMEWVLIGWGFMWGVKGVNFLGVDFFFYFFFWVC